MIENSANSGERCDKHGTVLRPDGQCILCMREYRGGVDSSGGSAIKWVVIAGIVFLAAGAAWWFLQNDAPPSKTPAEPPGISQKKEALDHLAALIDELTATNEQGITGITRVKKAGCMFIAKVEWKNPDGSITSQYEEFIPLGNILDIQLRSNLLSDTEMWAVTVEVPEMRLRSRDPDGAERFRSGTILYVGRGRDAPRHGKQLVSALKDAQAECPALDMPPLSEEELSRRRRTQSRTIKEGEKMVQGSLSKDQIRTVIHRNIDQVKECYERELANDKNLRGRVAIKFIITGDGSVDTAAVKESNLGNAAVEKCIVESATSWMFPQPKGGGIVIVTYPFKLAPLE